jgi:hypothetical protein
MLQLVERPDGLDRYSAISKMIEPMYSNSDQSLESLGEEYPAHKNLQHGP